ncbi:MAG: hypothetical protein LBU68_00255 [Rickettsiales bacterium]|jgi:hypothetical protein|nr:hypothetical protein [Rickettsiales bacterium]
MKLNLKTYFWDYKKLGEAFIAGKISEGTKALYFFIPYFVMYLLFALTALLIDKPIENAYQPTTIGFVAQIICLAIGAYLMRYLFKTNRDADNKDFLSRFFAFSTVISIRFIARTSVIIFASVLLGAISKLIGQFALLISIALMCVLMIVLFYEFINAFLHIKKVSLGGKVAVKKSSAKPTNKKISIKVGKVKSKTDAKSKKRK